MLQIGRGLALYAVHVWVQALEQQGPHARLRIARPETANFRLLEDVVTAHGFVCALAGEDDLEAALVHQLGQQKHRRRGGAENRLLGVTDYCRENRSHVIVGAVDRAVLSAQECTGFLLVSALVKFGVVKTH